jgi:rubrerythrin
MHEMTKDFLEAAFAGESMAHMRYLIFAEKAENHGLPNLTRLFRAIAYAERVHATNHYRELGNIKDAAGNLQTCIHGENFEVNEMYPVYNNAAKFQGEAGTVRSTHCVLEAGKIHEAIYRAAEDTVEKDGDPTLDTVHICPVCGAKDELFKAF